MRSSALEITIQSDVTSNRLQTLGLFSIPASGLTRKLVRFVILLLALVNTHFFMPQSAKAASPTPIPLLDTWQADMLPFGDLQCQYFLKGVYNGTLGQNFYGNGDPFYDGARVFYQIRDFTNDSKWDTCADKAAKQYRETQIDWTGQYGGGAAGWNNLAPAYGCTISEPGISGPRMLCICWRHMDGQATADRHGAIPMLVKSPMPSRITWMTRH